MPDNKLVIVSQLVSTVLAMPGNFLVQNPSGCHWVALMDLSHKLWSMSFHPPGILYSFKLATHVSKFPFNMFN